MRSIKTMKMTNFLHPGLLAAIVLVLSAGLFPQVLHAQNAASIVEKSRNRINAVTTLSRSRMTIRAKNGSTTERLMDQYSKDDAQGNNRSVIVFLSPASVKDIRFLTIENSGREDDRRIYLPELGRIRRIMASDGSSSFVGTDFSNDDISSQKRNTDLDNHRILREEKLNNADCYVIESVPKDASYQYSKMIQYIDKANLVNYRIDLYDKRGVQVKLLEFLELKEIQGRLTPTVTRMTTVAEGTSTTITAERLEYDGNIPESVFTDQYLTTGRAR